LGLCYLYLRNVRGFGWNHKRVCCIYCGLELNLRIKPSKRLLREKPEVLTVPQAINQVGLMDFMHDKLEDGKNLRLFNVIDDFNREASGIEVDFSLPSERVIRSLKQIIFWCGKPQVIRCDNGPENISGTIQTWTKEWGIRFEYIQLGKPQQNAYVERFNKTARYEWLSQYDCSSIKEVQDFATKWMWSYNHDRPNTDLGGFTPKQHLVQAALLFYFSGYWKLGGLPLSLCFHGLGAFAEQGVIPFAANDGKVVIAAGLLKDVFREFFFSVGEFFASGYTLGIQQALLYKFEFAGLHREAGLCERDL
jgi:putative transposase